MKNITDFINEATTHIELDPKYKWKNGVEYLYLGINDDNYGFLTEEDVKKVFRNFHVDEIKKLKPGDRWVNDDCWLIKIK